MPKRKKKCTRATHFSGHLPNAQQWELGVLVSTCLSGSVSGGKHQILTQGTCLSQLCDCSWGGVPSAGHTQPPSMVLSASVAPLTLGVGSSWHSHRLGVGTELGSSLSTWHLRAWRGAGETPKLRAKGGRAGTVCF